MKNLFQAGRLASVSCVVLASFALMSCSVPPGAGAVASAPVMSPSAGAEAASATVDAAKAKAKRSNAYAEERIAQQRPGLATGWGDEIQSGVKMGDFQRASSRPAGVASIYYNDKEGIKAMTRYSYSGSKMQKAANGLVEWGVKGSWGHLKNVHSSGKRFVVGSEGKNYTLVVRNLAHSDLEVVFSVDGLDVMDGKPASVRKRGYIIPAGKSLEVKGFRKSENAVAAFEFSSVRDSYASLSNQSTRNVGVLGMAVFTQKGVSPWRYGATEIKERRGARPFAEAPHVQARD